ncbi:Guanine nucleotide exchange factor for Cdc42p [Komagataella phaffii CBS 7435]|uniref:Guanine nucleotide exchange factor (GEF or GDP-release factor) for Cdc42p n=2 Tax=Komagataella phaffii TaxID=460519 RepID=C4QYR2_KOMPG|nr:Guanine nucleotide exchange factor (GEF or GDP-release factor) for Cdc42p [Komagataella phaffii GS115]AOA61287.1 GQ67_01616T0 [Komagataella phaffii]CAH2447211.1 Guanine nucleotide exchange factor for Cdc42p [Komagataella phaffii CBS 7435]AOA66891.1 GQ68_01632T0 [Komagataella phaffii GS115]CAY68386.1 Guanine nucleotide exchange factor (GEF or GDP-release factor) for Cdc42p [Komagataella phaffii GS115]CCA37452.1 Guanine nucleotide exchange factor for Cdc42p [Komagataella phaffii CBS 7435]
MSHLHIPPLRSNASSSLSIQQLRTPSAPMAAAPLIMNKQADAEESLYFIALKLKSRLAKISGMLKYLNLAATSTELTSERQTMMLAQQLSESKLGMYSSSGVGNRNSNGLDFVDSRRSSSTNNGSISSTRNSSGYQLSKTTTNTTTLDFSYGSSSLQTFVAGILPAQSSSDPVTTIWKLFQQGAPLCLLFDSIKPGIVKVVPSDELKICKMSIYEFLSACQTHLSLDGVELFTVTDVFTNDTNSLLKIIKVVNFLLDKYSNIVADPVDAELKVSDARSKVVRELVETERKYVLDLEILLKYKTELERKEEISLEAIRNMFPSLNEAVDFQRRFLVGLECNAAVPDRYQRIGSVYLHGALNAFRLYETWAVGQYSSIRFIQKEIASLRKSSTLIDANYELQSFLIKPIQRLCKYPLLLKELVKLTDESFPNYRELCTALEYSKIVAHDINEAQRRAENAELVKDLITRVKTWRGYDISTFGDLLFHSNLTVIDSDTERDFKVYLFQTILLFFKEEMPPLQTKKSMLSTRKKSSASLASSSHQSLPNGSQSSLGGVPPSELILKGRVFVAYITNISTTSSTQQGHCMAVTWSGNKDSGTFVMKFRSDETRSQWEQTLRKLSLRNDEPNYANKRLSSQDIFKLNLGRQRSESTMSNGSAHKMGSVSGFTPSSLNSMSSNSYFVPPSNLHSLYQDDMVKRSVSSPNSVVSTATTLSRNHSVSSMFPDINTYNSSSTTNSKHKNERETEVRIKFIYDNEPTHLSVPSSISFHELKLELIKNLRQNVGYELPEYESFRFKFKDEDDDYVRFQSSDDWVIAKEMLEEISDEEQRILEIVCQSAKI